ncbi:telomerase inhibitor [Sporothrix stenoceras]
MGLAGVKNKRKIGDDPNNTKWARNTDNYGHKILRAQGWEPGQYLGQQGAAHAANYTVASASHIRAVLREDNLGIGAAGPGANTANECTGLDIFKDLLGRLNGQSEEVIEEKRQARENAKMTLYVERRFGPMRFVRGGLLIGDDETSDSTDESTAETTRKTTDEAAATTTTESTSSTSTSETEAESDAKEARRKAKKERKGEKKEKSRKRKAEAGVDEADNSEEADDSDRKDKKRKRSKDDAEDEEKAEKKNSKKEKKEKKEKKDKKDKKEKKDKSEKKDKKDKKRRRDEESGISTGTGEDMDVDTATPSESEMVSSVPSTFAASSRNLARRRYINQKRAAVADPQALKQIFMIKA